LLVVVRPIQTRDIKVNAYHGRIVPATASYSIAFEPRNGPRTISSRPTSAPAPSPI
jgi:hypothetical protein